MKRSKFSEEQVVYALCQVEAGSPVGGLCRKLEQENGRLKRLVADLSLDKHMLMLSEALRKKAYGPHTVRNWPPGAGHLSGPWHAGLSCGSVQSGRLVSPQSGAGSISHTPAVSDIAQCRPRCGYLRVWVCLLREGWRVNLKRVRRLDRRDGLHLRMRARRRKHITLHREPAPTPAAPTERWSMDFVHDTLVDGRPFLVLTVVDNRSRHSPVLAVGFRISGATVGQALDHVLDGRSGPWSITVDHGTESQSRALEDGAYHRGIQLDCIRPGKPVENAYNESVHGRLRDECLNVHQFTSLADAHTKIAAWRLDYHQHRPHRSLGHLTPNEFVAQLQTIRAAEEVVCSS